MSATYQHPIRTDIQLIIGYPSSGPNESYATLHAEGCSHIQRRQLRSPNPFRGDENYYADDYFMVAPCARATKSKKAGTAEQLSGSDLSAVNSLARRYLTGRDPQGLDKAAEYLELCLNEEEEGRVRWWWNEGARDYARSEDHLAEINQLLLDRRAELYPKN